jgi:hypothetical protein
MRISAILAKQGNYSDPIIRKFFKWRAHRNIIFGIAFFGVINIAAGAFPLIHTILHVLGSGWVEQRFRLNRKRESPESEASEPLSVAALYI